MKTYFSFLKWFFQAIIIAGIMTITAYIGYFISYPLRKWLRKSFKPTKYNFYQGIIFFIIISILGILLLSWIFLLLIPILFQMSYYYLDDEVFELTGGEYGEKWYLKQNNLKLLKGILYLKHKDGSWKQVSTIGRFLYAYRWSVIRNPAWNMYQILKPEKGIKVIRKYGGYLSQNGIPVALSKFGVLKWIDTEGNYTDNQGAYISYRFSIFGTSYLLYDINGKRYWRYSYCKKNKTFNRFIELHLGYNDRRPTFRFKIKKGQIIY